jgi:hypothetical protein
VACPGQGGACVIHADNSRTKRTADSHAKLCCPTTVKPQTSPCQHTLMNSWWGARLPHDVQCGCPSCGLQQTPLQHLTAVRRRLRERRQRLRHTRVSGGFHTSWQVGDRWALVREPVRSPRTFDNEFCCPNSCPVACRQGDCSAARDACRQGCHAACMPVCAALTWRTWCACMDSDYKCFAVRVGADALAGMLCCRVKRADVRTHEGMT